MKVLAVALAICVSLSIFLALLSATSPVPSYPNLKQCPSALAGNTEESLAPKTGASNDCEGVTWENSFAVSSYDSALVPFQALTETAEAFALISIVVGVWMTRLRLPEIFKRGVNLPAPVQIVAILVVVAGSTVFALAALLDFSNVNPLVAAIAGSLPTPAGNPSLYAATSSAARDLGLGFLVRGWTDQIGGTGSTFSVIPFCCLVLSALGVAVVRMSRGLHAAVRDSIVWYGASALVLFELGLRLFVPAVTFQELSQVASAQIENVPVVSNWLVLLFSAALIVVAAEEAWRGRRVLGTQGTDESTDTATEIVLQGSSPTRELVEPT